MSSSDDCVEWDRYRHKLGYGVLRVDGKNRFAHRVAYCEHHGLRLEDIDGVVIRHKCDNPPCINPDHLEAGTQADNVSDMIKRGRKHRVAGESHGCAKLTAEQVSSIRSSYIKRSREFGLRALAAKFGVSTSQVFAIVTWRNWNASL